MMSEVMKPVLLFFRHTSYNELLRAVVFNGELFKTQALQVHQRPTVPSLRNGVILTDPLSRGGRRWALVEAPKVVGFCSNYISLKYSLQFCSFICQVASARRQRSDLFGLRVKLPPVTTILTTQT